MSSNFLRRNTNLNSDLKKHRDKRRKYRRMIAKSISATRKFKKR